MDVYAGRIAEIVKAFRERRGGLGGDASTSHVDWAKGAREECFSALVTANLQLALLQDEACQEQFAVLHQFPADGSSDSGESRADLAFVELSPSGLAGRVFGYSDFKLDGSGNFIEAQRQGRFYNANHEVRLQHHCPVLLSLPFSLTSVQLELLVPLALPGLHGGRSYGIVQLMPAFDASDSTSLGLAMQRLFIALQFLYHNPDKHEPGAPLAMPVPFESFGQPGVLKTCRQPATSTAALRAEGQRLADLECSPFPKRAAGQFDQRMYVSRNGYVLKFYDSYVDCNIAPNLGTVELALGPDYLPGGEVVTVNHRITVLTYRWIHGEYTKASSTMQFKQLYDDLRRLHEQGFVHGDVRLANMVFAPRAGEEASSGAGTRTCWLIDFDHVRKFGSEYPADYCQDLRERHSGAGPNAAALACQAVPTPESCSPRGTSPPARLRAQRAGHES